MAFHWFHNRGESQRTRFIALENGYHGETLGALAVGDIPLYRRIYAPLLAEALFAPSPDAWLAAPGETAMQRAHRAADALADLFDRHPGEICALILEPRLQCAGGMRMHDPVYLRRVRELCDANGVFLIADEIATGFGRTGTMFACEQAPPGSGGQEGGIAPDLLCLSKGLTGGFLPLSAVLATQALYDAFLDDSRERAQRLAVITVFQCNELRAPGFAAVAEPVERHLQRHLDAGRAVVGVEDLGQRCATGLARGQREQAFGQLHRGRMREAGQDHLLQRARLSRNGLGDARLGVPVQVGPPAADAIEIAATVVTEQPRAVPALDGNQRQDVRVLPHLGAGMPQHLEVARAPSRCGLRSGRVC
jgi:hypothetical protein